MNGVSKIRDVACPFVLLLALSVSTSLCPTVARADALLWTEQTASGINRWNAIASSADGTRLAATAWDGYIYTSNDGGKTWRERSTAQSRKWIGITSSADGRVLVAVVAGGRIYKSNDGGATWIDIAPPDLIGWTAIASSADGVNLVAIHDDPNDRSTILLADIYTSTDGGKNWTKSAGSRHWSGVVSSADGVHLAGGDYFGEGSGGYIYTSADGGKTWTEQTGSGRHNVTFLSSSADGTKLALAASGDGIFSAEDWIYTSNDGGVTWTQQTAAGKRYWSGIASSADGKKIAAIANDSNPTSSANGHIYLSVDGGKTWTDQGSTERVPSIVTFSADGTKLITAQYPGYIYTAILSPVLREPALVKQSTDSSPSPVHSATTNPTAVQPKKIDTSASNTAPVPVTISPPKMVEESKSFWSTIKKILSLLNPVSWF